jgi:hypothetical protein
VDGGNGIQETAAKAIARLLASGRNVRRIENLGKVLLNALSG